jgi:ethanolamine ammonia-lyase large subunit
MPNKVVKETAGGQGRHFMGAVGGILIGSNLNHLGLDQQSLEAIQTLLNQFGVGAAAQAGIGSLMVMLAAYMSYTEKKKRAKENPE